MSLVEKGRFQVKLSYKNTKQTNALLSVNYVKTAHILASYLALKPKPYKTSMRKLYTWYLYVHQGNFHSTFETQNPEEKIMHVARVRMGG